MVYGHWYYDGRADPWSETCEPKEDDWQLYDEVENEMIEDAYEKGESEALLDDYAIDLKRKFQYDYCDVKRQRPVMRRTGDIIEYKHRKKRFDIPEIPETKTFTDSDFWSCQFIEEWIRRNPHYSGKSETIDQVSSGIIEEGRKLERIRQAQFLVEKLKEMKKDMIDMSVLEKFCINLYTRSSFIYSRINEALRENDLSKVDTLGPVCCLLRDFLSKRNSLEVQGDKIAAIPHVIYRGTTLNPSMLQLYKDSQGQVKSWLGFSSTSKCRDVAEMFGGNTLFILEFATDTAPVYPGRYIKSLSQFLDEEEVLLYPGVDFRIEKVIESTKDDDKNLIYLTLM